MNNQILRSDYRYGFSKPENYTFKSKKGLNKKTVEEISRHKNEPEWMLRFRLEALAVFYKKQMPVWGGDLSRINFDDIYYYIKPIKDKAGSWEELPKEIQKTLGDKGVIFLDMDTGLREFPDLVREYFVTLIPPQDNKFSALNSAVWSGGSFIYVPKGVKVELPLQAYFRINAA